MLIILILHTICFLNCSSLHACKLCLMQLTTLYYQCQRHIWRDQYLEIMDACIPKVVLKGPTNSLSYRQRDNTTKYFVLLQEVKVLLTGKKYKIVRNKVIAMLRRNKQQYFYKLKISFRKDFWKDDKETEYCNSCYLGWLVSS